MGTRTDVCPLSANFHWLLLADIWHRAHLWAAVYCIHMVRDLSISMSHRLTRILFSYKLYTMVQYLYFLMQTSTAH